MTSPRNPADAERDQRRKERRAMAVVSVIITLSVLLSYNWASPDPSFRPDAPIVIFLGILVSAIIYIASRASTGSFRPRFCPNCGRQIPFDALLCSYCGHRLP